MCLCLVCYYDLSCVSDCVYVWIVTMPVSMFRLLLCLCLCLDCYYACVYVCFITMTFAYVWFGLLHGLYPEKKNQTEEKRRQRSSLLSGGRT